MVLSKLKFLGTLIITTKGKKRWRPGSEIRSIDSGCNCTCELDMLVSLLNM